MEIKGFVTEVYDLREGTSSNGNCWKRQDIVVAYGSMYSPHNAVLTLNSKLAGTIHRGDKGKFTFDPDSFPPREANGRRWGFNNCWQFEKEQSDSMPAQ